MTEQIEFCNWGLAAIGNSSTVPSAAIKLCKDYRQAVRLCRHLSKIKRTNLNIAESCGLYASHCSEYFAEQEVGRKGVAHRNLPADKIRAVETFLGNTAISQWLAYQAGLTVLEEIQLARAA